MCTNLIFYCEWCYLAVYNKILNGYNVGLQRQKKLSAVMENKLAKYGVKKPISRPKIKPTKQLNLDTPEGQRLVYTEAREILAQHKKTFRRLASM